jgi:hypothetical protein
LLLTCLAEFRLIGRVAFSFFLGSASLLYGQATPTASRAADLQIGIGYSLARPDYPPPTFQGVTAYADLDLRRSLGLEAEFHQVNNTGSYQSFQRTYEIGARYHRTWGPLLPYVKAMVGRGQLEYPFAEAIGAYNMFAGGVGADVTVAPWLRIRGEYELQRWSSFPNGGLTPQIFTLGVAYHFAGRSNYR